MSSETVLLTAGVWRNYDGFHITITATVIFGTMVEMDSDTKEDNLLCVFAEQCTESDGADPEQTKESNCLAEEELSPIDKKGDRD